MQNGILAIDIGSTRLKAGLLDASGNMLALALEPSPLDAGVIDPAQVMAAAAAAAQQVCATRPGAIAITGATRTTVFADSAGQPIGPAIALADGRGAEQALALQAAYGANDAFGLGAFHPLARVLDLRQREPERFGRMRRALDLKDWINLLLTGVAQTDSVALARIAPADGDIGAVLARLDLPADLLGGSALPGSLIATVGAAAPAAWQWCRGVPVVQCGFDAWCASYGMGAVQAGSVYNVCGTTDVFGGFVAAPVARQGIACLPWGQGLWHLGGPCLTGLSTLAWFGRQFLGNPDPAAVLACAATARDDCPLALPFVHGERMPFWRADLRAQWLGVHAAHGVPEFARALIDGLLLFQHWLIRQLDARPQAVYLGGGGSTLAGWAQAKASAFGLPLRLPADDEPALRGAAMCALTALRHHASLADSQQALHPAYREVAPDPAQQARLHALEPRIRPLLDALQAQ